VSYANAFVKPVSQTRKESLMDASIAALSGYREKLRRAYGLNGTNAYVAVNGQQVTDAEAQESLPNLQQWLAQQLPE
jgi:hypothetical protein